MLKVRLYCEPPLPLIWYVDVDDDELDGRETEDEREKFIEARVAEALLAKLSGWEVV